MLSSIGVVIRFLGSHEEGTGVGWSSWMSTFGYVSVVIKAVDGHGVGNRGYTM